MISENSDLFRSHPDWILHVPPYHQPVGRYGIVVEHRAPGSWDYLFNVLGELLTRYSGIKYLKWDIVVGCAHWTIHRAQTGRKLSLSFSLRGGFN